MKDPLYLESSAILAWLLHDTQGQEVAALMNEAETIVTSSLTLLEVNRSLIRYQKNGDMTEAHGQGLRALLGTSSRLWMLMNITDEILQRAAESFPIEPIRSLDAIHLATALHFSKTLSTLKVMSLDKRIIENLLPLGLNYWTH